MIADDFHPEVRRDLDEILDFIATDDSEAADRLIAEMVGAIDALVPFPRVGRKRPDLPRPHRTAPAFHFGARILDCRRAGGKAALGCRRDARKA